jgi:3-isopropylmalate/(R)-2-methylmalate dehydratase small subunit
VLLARRNFGCGSSREHAPWAIAEFGFRAVVAPSFADIFYNNCFKNGILPVVLDERVVDGLFQAVQLHPGYQLSIDLVEQRVLAPDGTAWPFSVDAFRRECLLNGWDDIGLTLRHADEIREFEALRLRRFPWLARNLPV